MIEFGSKITTKSVADQCQQTQNGDGNRFLHNAKNPRNTDDLGCLTSLHSCCRAVVFKFNAAATASDENFDEKSRSSDRKWIAQRSKNRKKIAK